ncbi:MAG: hypothetical protein V2I33_16770 [Kangiellaceae bacterium]|nr:hypothetical protein [Kangiellaceae bacterium]
MLVFEDLANETCGLNGVVVGVGKNLFELLNVVLVARGRLLLDLLVLERFALLHLLTLELRGALGSLLTPLAKPVFHSLVSFRLLVGDDAVELPDRLEELLLLLAGVCCVDRLLKPSLLLLPLSLHLA